MKKILFLLLLVGYFITPVLAQEQKTQVPSLANKRFFWGFTFNNYWSSIEGNEALPEYFYKPSLGGALKVEYYLTPYLGISLAPGYQQRGAGIKVKTNFYELSPPAIETYRTRLRFNSIDVPLSLVFRTPEPIRKGSVRLSAAAGINPQWMFKAVQIRHSIEDGFHDIEDKTHLFNKFDMGVVGSMGADINTGGSILQVHLVGNWGSQNVFNSQEAYPDHQGQNRMYGIRLGCLF